MASFSNCDNELCREKFSSERAVYVDRLTFCSLKCSSGVIPKAREAIEIPLALKIEFMEMKLELPDSVSIQFF